MSTLLVILAFLFLLAGLLGSIVPVIPGPPLGFAGLLLLQWSGHGGFSSAFLLLWAAIIIAVTIIDYILPALMTKRFGGSRAAVIGSVLGLITGIIFFAPTGLLIGPFLGAFAGELINYHFQTRNSEINDTNNPADTISSGYIKALKVAFGALLAFIVGTGIKLVIGALMIFYAVKAMFSAI
ncbi:MAG: DUF456 domain-containing protein [Treponema sp.]|nr:DUF456 domain-containing protein [Treponema sp.]